MPALVIKCSEVRRLYSHVPRKDAGSVMAMHGRKPHGIVLELVTPVPGVLTVPSLPLDPQTLSSVARESTAVNV